MEKKINHGTLQYHIAIIWEPNSNRYTLQFRCAFRCHLGTPLLQSNRVARYYGPNYLNINTNSGENVIRPRGPARSIAIVINQIIWWAGG